MKARGQPRVVGGHSAGGLINHSLVGPRITSVDAHIPDRVEQLIQPALSCDTPDGVKGIMTTTPEEPTEDRAKPLSADPATADHD